MNFDYRNYHEQRYANALTAYANGSGARYDTHSKALTWEAAKLGKTPDEVLADLSGLMQTTAHDRDLIRRGVATATAKIGATPIRFHSNCRTPRDTEPSGVPDYVRHLIADGGGSATGADLRALSPQKLEPLTADGATTFAFLWTLWEPTEYLHIFRSDCHRRAQVGVDLRTRDEWLGLLTSCHALPGDCIGKNPYSGKRGTNGTGQPSFTVKECVAAYRYALIEFDHLPLQEQAAFWRGVLSRPKLAPLVMSLTYSGGKSIHGLVKTNATPDKAEIVERDLARLFCADPEKRTRTKADGSTETYYPYRADPATLKPHGGTRLAGSPRIGNGQQQTLLYLAMGT